ncbi:MAG: hypothetical protein NC314_10275 [Roseburia sp.]|nr:hypothetical protein [Roseburia sp.]MCM1243217.1 hypothetical protein [Roseburia sp.]
MEYLYHGSSIKCEVLVPHQAIDTGFAEGCQNAVYATSDKNMALAFALGARPDENGELERVMLPEYGNIMVFEKGTPDYGGKGYLYILDKAGFQHALGTQWVSFKAVKPIKIIEINVDDHLDLCMVKEKGKIDIPSASNHPV